MNILFSLLSWLPVKFVEYQNLFEASLNKKKQTLWKNYDIYRLRVTNWITTRFGIINKEFAASFKQFTERNSPFKLRMTSEGENSIYLW